MTSCGSACGGRGAPVRVNQANGVVGLKATLELPSAVELPDLRMEGVYETAGVRARCSDSSKKCSARAWSDAGDGPGITGSCTGIGAASIQGRARDTTGEGKEACKAYGGRVAAGS